MALNKYINNNESYVSTGGDSTVSVPTGAANTVIKAAAGRLCRAVVTTTGTAAAGVNAQFFDNASTNSGTVIAVIPGNAAAGTTFDFSMPAFNGIVCQNVALGPVFTVSFL